MRIGIMGTGGLGGYFGGVLAGAGQDVVFIARGPHLQAIRERGLRVKSPLYGDFVVSPARATEDPGEVGSVDLVLFTTKTYHSETAIQALKPMIGKETVVVSLQNGIDAADLIGAHVGMEHLVGGAAWLSAALEAPGVIGQYSQFRRIVVGEFDGKITPRLKRIHEAFQSAGINVEMSNDISKVLWTKFVFISSVSAIGSLTRVAFGEYRDLPETRGILIKAIEEISAVARAGGVRLDQDVVDKTIEFIDNGAPQIKPSMQRDVEAGRPSEIESLIGVVPGLAKLRKVPAPVMEFAYAMLKPGDLKAQGGLAATRS